MMAISHNEKSIETIRNYGNTWNNESEVKNIFCHEEQLPYSLYVKYSGDDFSCVDSKTFDMKNDSDTFSVNNENYITYIPSNDNQSSRILILFHSEANL